MASMKDFLTNYYNRLIFKEMSYEQFAQFCGYIKNNKATDKQKIWAEELLKKDPATGEFETGTGTDIYIRKPLPDVTDPTEGLSDEEWIKLFKAFQTAFQSMDASKNDFKYNEKAKKFLETYFGTNPDTGLLNMFQPEQIRPAAEHKIYQAPTPPSHAAVPGTLYWFLETYKPILEPRFQGGYYGIISDEFSYKDLLDGIRDGKYKTKASFREKLLAVAGYIEGYKSDLVTAGVPRSEIPNLSDYQDWYDNSIDTFRLDQFKYEYADLLNKLREEPKIREVFAQHDKGKISGPLNKALEIKSYDDPQSEEYVQPKREETMNLPEQVAKWWGDTYSDCLEKYVKLRGDRVFFSKEAKAICKYLQKDLKKTDGLDGVLKNIAGAKDKLQKVREFKAKKHLDWFEKTLNDIKNDPNMSKVWSSALRNGTHMRSLAKEIIVRAINDKDGPKTEEAKTALELLSVLHYEYTTSNIMDALGKMDVTIFSDKGLSFNKNAGMQLITNALDKGIKFAMLGIGYGITMGVNAIQMSGRKINRYSNRDGKGNFKEEHDQYLRGLDAKRRNLEDQITMEQTHLTTTEGDVNRIRAGRTYDVAKQDIENNLTTLIGNANAAQAAWDTAIQDFNEHLYDPASGNPLLSNPDMLLVSNFISSLNSTPLPTTIPVLSTPTVTIGGTTYDLHAEMRNLLTLRNTLNTNITQRDNEQTELDKLVHGTELIQQLSNQITRHQDEYNNWDANHVDEFEKLVKHWNLLETGRNTHTGPMYNWFRHLSAKKAQEDLNTNSASIIAEYNRTHSIAA